MYIAGWCGMEDGAARMKESRLFYYIIPLFYLFLLGSEHLIFHRPKMCNQMLVFFLVNDFHN